MTIIKTKISGTGHFVPKKILHNKDLEKIVDTSDQWIFERTGIRERHICNTDGGEFPTDMATYAAKDALEEAKLNPNDIDMIIFSSVTPDYKLPNSACVLQQKLGITNNCAAMDIAVACSGFVYGSNMANSFIKQGLATNILVVGSEMLSREVDWSDRNICILFGDGCGVAIYSKNTDPNDPSDIIACQLGADGKGAKFFDQLIGGAVTPLTSKHLEDQSHLMKMKGKEMFKVATRTLANSARETLKKANKTIEDIDWIVPHQANIRILETTAKLLGVSLDKFIINIEKYGNTSAATVPIAFNEAIKDGRIKRGDTILFDAFGAGLTFGSTLLTY